MLFYSFLLNVPPHSLDPIDIRFRLLHPDEHCTLLGRQQHRRIGRTLDVRLDGQRSHRGARQIGAGRPLHLRTAHGYAAIGRLIAVVTVQDASFAGVNVAAHALRGSYSAVRGTLELGTRFG